MSEGTLVTATVTARSPASAPGAWRSFTPSIRVRLQELYTWDDDPHSDDSDGYQMHGDLLDLEPALRDALVLELPLSPLCSQDCAGPCAECGARLADAADAHAHAAQHMTTPDGAAVPGAKEGP